MINLNNLKASLKTDDFVIVEEVSSSLGFAYRAGLGFKYGILNMNVAYLGAPKLNEVSVADITINAGLLFTIGEKKRERNAE